MAALTDGVGLTEFMKRQDGVNQWLHPARINQLGDSGQLLAAGLNEHESAADAVFGSNNFRWRTDDGHQDAAGF